MDLNQVLENQIDCMETPESQILQFKMYDDIEPTMVLESLPICQEQTLEKVMLIVSVVVIGNALWIVC